MNQIEDLNSRDQEAIKRLLAIDPSSLNYAQILHLRARRSYLSNEQKFKYCGVLYFPRPFLYQDIKNALKFLSIFTNQIILAIISGLIVYWIIKLSGW
ncbi:hypothetical protein A3J19_02585 [Candidatus Daviesbacteria bacterium RIFCSPLOWO2_02_FULL_41_8]|uniref:Uncharacterized protein n=3 Tax=Candidatus Daviesiibacteriota TaxID=1752718 RepID=A0A1F5NLU3_9BACT|nr:MAG: hypothetical protein A2871_03390 [Candidatus Daviesbacteria bacterium RIFCSPHIGHO2_01_FULL_41_23]OGE32447.1 MAG: hypothetical protein A3D83_02230 [Candidatus Daviesbacteria bacterium RIFCSPHIGHO2_02_FULL_41_10]OGE61967.1 MAG: hypothetical protein A2967_03205 [Candidatus Daviesbacteria bacterium RIFCSPLOWO2_01_FULL_41_32]OGE78492.1 MAG: hypothetical protein A3J19_02585 [Candidatus Daviesbacteria bacterium RIFCSPLOWO2_02_FULL_41_8]